MKIINIGAHKTGTMSLTYTEEVFNSYIEDAKQRKTKYYHETDKWFYQALGVYPINGKRVLICGSEKPWYEAICLAFGCTDITVVEYNKRICEQEHIKYLQSYDNDKYDVIISISTFEHDGLGRYGDTIDPDGDLKAMSKVRGLLAKNGVLILAVPIGPEQIVGNLHRVYGRHRLGKLRKGFEVINYFGFKDEMFDISVPDRQTSNYQPVFVLEKI
jgi:hypothetical protein